MDDVPIVTLDQTRGYHGDLHDLGTGFQRLAWDGFLFVDGLKKLLFQTRPYERQPGECDALYQEMLRRGAAAAEARRDLRALMEEAVGRFAAIEVDREAVKPRIGIIGEIYVRCNGFTNNQTIRRIEALGGEAVAPPLEEWVNYINHLRREDLWEDRNLGGMARELCTEAFQRLAARRMQRPLRGVVRHFWREEPTRKIIDRGRPYIHDSVRGEPILSMGRAVEYAEMEFEGVVNLAPFNCMPGTIVNALLNRYRADHNDIPVLKLSFDGVSQANEDTRLEAFMHQARTLAEQRAGRVAAEVTV
jgi:predicted nucleotide-binding protein (sugar kinase/HSP70/actin superfamily)